MTKQPFLKRKYVKDGLLIVGLALILIVSVYKVFLSDTTDENVSDVLTGEEKKLSRLLENIDGVGKNDVMIYETEEGIQGVVIVCQGAKDIKVYSDIIEAVSVATGTDRNNIKIYLKKE